MGIKRFRVLIWAIPFMPANPHHVWEKWKNPHDAGFSRLVTQRGFEPEINHHIRSLSGACVAFRVACYPKSLLKYASTLSSTAERSALNVCWYTFCKVEFVVHPPRSIAYFSGIPSCNMIDAFRCPYGIITTNRKSPVESRVLRFSVWFFHPFSNRKITLKEVELQEVFH